MNKIISNRIKKEAEYIIDTKKTIREAAKHFHLSKSTIHKDIHDRLLFVSPILYKKVRAILNIHLAERHIKGGESTKQIYLKKQAS